MTHGAVPGDGQAHVDKEDRGAARAGVAVAATMDEDEAGTGATTIDDATIDRDDPHLSQSVAYTYEHSVLLRS